MEVEIHQVSVMGSIEGLVGRHMGIWDNRFTRSQNYGMFGQPGAVRMTLLQR